MISPDYSKDAMLLDEEVYDYDTSDVHETGINSTRMRLPTRYDISKFYKRNKRNKERGQWKKKDPNSLIDFSEDFDWQITYSFPNTLRDNITNSGATYGGSAVTFRRLYLILCEHFNDGAYFVDDYFDSVYPYSAVKQQVDSKLSVIKQDLLDLAETELEDYVENGKLKRGGKARIAEYEKFARQWEDSEGEELATLIKEDIIASLASGAIPLNFSDSTETRKRRRKAGLSETPTLYATAQLIEHIQLYVTLRGNKRWQTKQGIMV